MATRSGRGDGDLAGDPSTTRAAGLGSAIQRHRPGATGAGRFERHGDRRRRHRADALDGVDRRRRRPACRCARSGATGSGCARSTPRRRRRSTSARRPGATSASGATSRATCSRSSRSTSTSTSSAPSSTSPPRPGSSSRTRRRAVRERARRKRLVEAMARRSSGTTDACSTIPARPAARLPAQPGLSGDVARQFKLGWAPDDWDALARGVGDRRRAAARRAGVHQPAQPDAGRLPGAACCSRSSRRTARRWRSAGGSCRGPTTRRSTRTRRRRRSTPSRRRSTG